MSDLELGPDFSPVFIPRTVTESIRCLPTEVDETHTHVMALWLPHLPPSPPQEQGVVAKWKARGLVGDDGCYCAELVGVQRSWIDCLLGAVSYWLPL